MSRCPSRQLDRRRLSASAEALTFPQIRGRGDFVSRPAAESFVSVEALERRPDSIVMRWLVLLVIAFAPLPLVRGAEPDNADWIMYRDPKLPVPERVARFPPGLVELWQRALERPEREMKRRTAVAIAEAKRRGLDGLTATVPRLADLVRDPREDPSVQLSAAAALVALDARDSADVLLETLEPGKLELASRVEPALARWNHVPAVSMWQERLGQDVVFSHMHILAIRGLAACGAVDSVPRLQELAFDPHVSPNVRLEAAVAVGKLRDSGVGELASGLLQRQSPASLLERLVAVRILASDQSDEAKEVLTSLATTAEPVVQAPALRHLKAMDPQLVARLHEQLLASEDVKVRRLGCEALVETASEDTPGNVALLVPRLDDADPSLRQFVRASLREISEIDALRDEVISEARQVLNDGGWRGQEQAIRLLVGLDQKSVVDRLLELLGSPREEVLVASAWGLCELQVDRTREPIQKVFEATSDRLTAGEAVPPGTESQLALLAQALGRMEHAPAIARLKTYVPKGSPFAHVSRAAAIWALGKLLADRPDQTLVDQLVGRITDVNSPNAEEPLVRRMAAVSLGRLGEPRSLSALRQMVQLEGAAVDTGIACVWAIGRIKGEPLPDIPPTIVAEDDWFLVPAAGRASGGGEGEADRE